MINTPAEASRRVPSRGSVLSIALVATGAAIAMVTGGVVLLGWYSGIPFLLKLHPEFVAMQYNTAVALILGGAGILAALRGRRGLAGFFGAAVAGLGGAVLFEHVTGVDLGIDLMLWNLGVDRETMQQYTTVRTSAPGRLAPNTALGLLCAGTILMMVRSIGRHALASLAGSLLGMTVICIGLIAMLGYVGSAPSAYGWANMTRMALHTAGAITALGIALSALVAVRTAAGRHSFFERLPWLVGVGGVVVSLGLWIAALDREHVRIQTEVGNASTGLQRQATVLIDARIRMLTRLAMRWNYSGRPSHERWEYEAGLNLGTHDGFQAIAWLDGSRTLQWIVPTDTGARAVLLTAAALPSTGQAMDEARSVRVAVLSTIQSPATGTSLLLTQSLHPAGRFDGFLLGHLSPQHTFDGVVRQAVLSEYAIAVYEGNRLIYERSPGGSSLEPDWSRDVMLNLHGVTWRMRVTPSAAALVAVRTSAPTLTPVVTLLLTALLVWLIRLSLQARAQEQEAAAGRERERGAVAARERAIELAEVNDRLREQIAERERAEEQQRSLQEQLLQSQKMEAIGKLAGGVAHDFNNLLTVISGYSDMLLTEFKPEDRRHEDVSEIKRAAHRAAALTSQLLAFSRKQVMQPRILDLNEVVNGLDGMLRRLIGADVELVTCTAVDLGLIKADPGQLEQVIVNLAVNARDAMPHGGRLMIETSNAELSDDVGDRHIGAASGSFVALTVSDTGNGMSRETIDQIFEPFFTTKEVGKGTGLGLSTVYGIVKQSDGDLWVYSEVGKGSAFKLYFPRLDADAVAYRPVVAELGALTGIETILVVEDDEAVRDLARKILVGRGYDVHVARNGLEALELCERRLGGIDLIITDMVMPELNGRGLVERLMEQYPRIRVLYMSGYTDDDSFRRGDVEAGVPFIQKPFTPVGLAKKVRTVLDEPAMVLSGRS